MNAIESPLLTKGLPHLHALMSMDRITNRMDIDEAIKYCRLLLASLQQSPAFPITMRDSIIMRSCGFLRHAFELTNNPEYLDESIDVLRRMLKLPHAEWTEFPVIQLLLVPLLSRFMLSGDSKDFDEMMQLFPIAATNTSQGATTRFNVACKWADWAWLHDHSSTPTAYDHAISLMQDALTFAPTLEIQHFHLVQMRNDIENLPLNYASYLAHIGQLKQAIETLERGRGLVWSEMRGLRTSIDSLLRVDRLLARKFAALNGDLEALTTSVSPMDWAKGGGVDGNGEIDPFGDVVVKQRKLLDERNSLITQIRLLAGFENFLMAPSFDTLRSAAAHGPVIIINHSKWRCDIIILLYNCPPSPITAPKDFYDRAERLKDQLSAVRKEGLDSPEYDAALTFVLEELYDMVGLP